MPDDPTAAVRAAVLAVAAALEPCARADPLDDPRLVGAVEYLASFIGTPAAWGVAEALGLLRLAWRARPPSALAALTA